MVRHASFKLIQVNFQTRNEAIQRAVRHKAVVFKPVIAYGCPVQLHKVCPSYWGKLYYRSYDNTASGCSSHIESTPIDEVNVLSVVTIMH